MPKLVRIHSAAPEHQWLRLALREHGARWTGMTDMNQYLKVGHSSDGALHAAPSYWSSMCSTPLVRVDDRHQFPPSQLAEHVTCQRCLGLLANVTSAELTDLQQTG
jgi:hypothetical protein